MLCFTAERGCELKVTACFIGAVCTTHAPANTLPTVGCAHTGIRSSGPPTHFCRGHKHLCSLLPALLLVTAARREKQDAEAAAAAAQAQMVAEVKAARDEAAAQRKQHRAELETAKEGADSKMKEYVGKFREQVRLLELAKCLQASIVCVLTNILSPMSCLPPHPPTHRR